MLFIAALQPAVRARVSIVLYTGAQIIHKFRTLFTLIVMLQSIVFISSVLAAATASDLEESAARLLFFKVRGVQEH